MQGPKGLNVSKTIQECFSFIGAVQHNFEGKYFDFCSFDDDVDFFSLFLV